MGRSSSKNEAGLAMLQSTSTRQPDIKKMSKPLPLLPSRRAMLEEANNSSKSPKVSSAILELGKIIANEQITGNSLEELETSDSSSTTIKKGTLWQQQNYDKFHQRILNRWKKRYFILTTDYLVCFAKSSSKVGHSAMGKFRYKISLNDVTKIEWLRPKKIDKGPIVLDIKGSFGLSLWAKIGLDEWMDTLNGTCQVSKYKRPNQICLGAIIDHTKLDISQISNVDLNKNISDQANHTRCDVITNGSIAINRMSMQPTKTIVADNGRIVENDCSVSINNSMTPSSRLEKVKCSTNEAEASTMIMQDQTDSYNKEKDDSGRTQTKIDGEKEQAANSDEGAMLKVKQVSSKGQTHSDSEQSAVMPDRQGGSAKSDRLSDLSCQRHLSPDENELGETIQVEIPVSLEKPVENSAIQDMTSDVGPQRMRKELSSSAKPERPNLIRRDDSWQSLVSLTRVGVNPMQVAQRHLVPQHTLGLRTYDQRQGYIPIVEQNSNSSLDTRQRMNIESTVTPLRGPSSLLRRQQSIQTRLPVSQNYWQHQHQHASSFDAPSCNQVRTGLNQSSAITSYHDKLMQLQMMHNSNNVRQNEYQIYGPDSIATNHYGYYSMRSNMKSAASEFSFIRPSSSGIQPIEGQLDSANHLTPRAKLPHQSSSYLLNSRDTNSQSQQLYLDAQHNRLSLVITPSGSDRLSHTRVRDNNNNNVDFVRNQATDIAMGKTLYSGQNVDDSGQITLADLAPNRELPLKPNRKRATSALEPSKKGSSSISSNIAGFFRRAFSRRSTRRERKSKKLTESCSSSLGAFDENSFPSAPITQSAFSTGNKSVSQQQPRGAIPPQRMIDIIEAFANKTILGNNYRQQNALGLTRREIFGQQQQDLSSLNNSSQQLAPHTSTSNQQMRPQATLLTNDVAQISSQQQILRNNQSGSLLNKSSSMSTTMALADSLDNPHGPHRGISNEAVQDIIAARRHANKPIVSQIESDSPRTSRPGRVMSANLTPLFARANLQQAQADSDQPGMSPRDTSRVGDPLPRPSSIYGQPSMISSSITCSHVDRLANFGAHRNSFNVGRAPITKYDHHRRSNLIKAPFLDTTREVSEEVSTPTMEEVVDLAQSARLMDNSDSLYQRHALAHSILHSSTMNTIYDNHPLVQRNDGSVNNSSHGVTIYSHYDNQYLRDLPPNDGYNDRSFPTQPTRFAENSYQLNRSLVDQDQDIVPPRPMSNLSASDNSYAAHYNARMMIYNKPAAIVAPRTPSRSMLANCTPTRDLSSHALIDRVQETRSSGRSLIPPLRSCNDVVASISPLASRRALHDQPSLSGSQWSYYQQSPLVDRQTRMLKRSDGTQATIIGGPAVSDYAQPIIDNAAPSDREVNSESVLRKATIDMLDPVRDGSSVNTVLAKAYSISSQSRHMSNDNSNDSVKDFRETISDLSAEHGDTSQCDRTRIDGYAPNSRSDNSSCDRTSSKAGSNGSKSLIRSKNNCADKRRKSKDSSSSKASLKASRSNGTSSSQFSADNGRDSSTEQSDELTSRHSISDEPEERNWIISKLVH